MVRGLDGWRADRGTLKPPAVGPLTHQPSTLQRAPSARSLGLRRRQMIRATQPLEDLRRALAAELVGEANAAQLRIVGVDHDGAAHDARAGDVADHAVQHRTVRSRYCERADRDLTT